MAGKFLHEVASILRSDEESIVPSSKRPKGLDYVCRPGGKSCAIGVVGGTRGEIQLTSPNLLDWEKFTLSYVFLLHSCTQW